METATVFHSKIHCPAVTSGWLRASRTEMHRRPDDWDLGCVFVRRRRSSQRTARPEKEVQPAEGTSGLGRGGING